jgi:hypothetical protein
MLLMVAAPIVLTSCTTSSMTKMTTSRDDILAPERNDAVQRMEDGRQVDVAGIAVRWGLPAVSPT